MLAVVAAGGFALLVSGAGVAVLLGALIGVATAAIVLRRTDEPAAEAIPLPAVDAVSHGVVVLDRSGGTVSCSEKATESLGSPAREPAGAWLGRFEPDSEARLRDALEPSDDEESHELTNLSGLVLACAPPSRYGASVLRTGGSGAVVVLVDETEAVDIETLRAELMSMVTHEIRGPLSTVRGFAQMLMVKDIPPERASELVEVIHRQSNRVVNLVNDFLDVSRVESGRQPLARAPVDLAPIIQSTLSDLEPLAKEKSITLSRPTNDGLPSVWADRNLIEQVLINLVSNAIKYSPDSSTVRVGVSAGPDAVEVSVEDDGLGIPEEAIPRLFDKFYRVRGDDHGDVMGTGLGLSLAKRIVELHEGTIRAESALGHGSRFLFTVPVYHPGAIRASAAPRVGATSEELRP